MTQRTIDIGRDFSDVPSGRVPDDGEFNGKRFRDEFLVPALRENDKVLVNIDHTEGYGSSFLEEAFGGLIRDGKFSYEELSNKLEILSNEPRTHRYKRKIESYLRAAKHSAP